MKTKLILLSFCLLSTVAILGQNIIPSNKANKAQKQLEQRAYGMFIHFGVNTFSGLEWSDGTTPAEMYNPTDLDCDQWIRVASQAGFRYVILITKHHDGFCLWDSKYTDYDIASSPVKTDVVAEVAKACKKYGLKFGIYYSLWDRHEHSYKGKDFGAYIDFMEKQLIELLTNYGPVCELWFDGGWNRKNPLDWQLERIYSTIKKIQPDCAVGVNSSIVIQESSLKRAIPDSMTVDNKYYTQYFPNEFRLSDPLIAHKFDKKQYLYHGKSYYLPYEHTICLSKAWNWFQKSTPQPVRELDELEELFYWCTDNNNNLVINIPPDNTGKIRENEANAIIDLANRLNLRKNKKLPKNGEFISIKSNAFSNSIYDNNTKNYGPQNATDGGMITRWAASDTTAFLSIDLDPAKTFNKIAIYEYCDSKPAPDGFSNYRTNRIQSYNIDILINNKWKTIYVSDVPMGDCKVIRFPQRYKTSQIRLNVLKALAPPSVYEFHVINI
jgi:alpha-L-fucosidase